MVMVVDKPPIVGGDLPPLPPFLRKRREEPERRTLIMPDPMSMFESYGHHLMKDHRNNWQTSIYHHMIRVVRDSLGILEDRWEYAHSSSRQYRQWLETYHYPSGIPPHVQFAGCIESGRTDPAFKDRWEAWARETFF